MRLRATLISFLGCALVAIAALQCAMVAMNARAAASGGRDLAPLLPEAAVVAVTGFGLVLHRKWAAILFLVISGAWSLYLIVGSLVYVHNAWLFINFAFGCMLVLLMRVVMRRWAILG